MKKQIGKLLANFILIVDDQKCLMTSKNLEDIVLVKEDYESKYPQYDYIIKDFAVKVQTRNGFDHVVIWHKIKGYSLWQLIDNV